MTSKQLKTATPYMFLTPKYDRLVGVAMHQHTDGWNAQVKGNGSKLWIMYPPQVRPGPEGLKERVVFPSFPKINNHERESGIQYWGNISQYW
jgi:hypothetical protein